MEGRGYLGKMTLTSPKDDVDKLCLRSYNNCIYVFSFEDNLPGGLRFGDQLLRIKDECVTGLPTEKVIEYCKQLSGTCEVCARPG
ncbi:unnamed protein product [Schistocephalus solidus]|uniref:PDZ domain-containing protein n=1 Tax=Schistocephalus solidus TaxID=70667 RepID=A0A183S9J4_SCHSO|nr:unnamed protein product [Schistocephalus solidus]